MNTIVTQKLLITLFGTIGLIFILMLLKNYFNPNSIETFSGDYQKLESVYSKGEPNQSDFEEDWDNQTLAGCKQLCDDNNQCQGFYRNKELEDSQAGKCFPISKFDCQTEYIADNRNHQNQAKHYNTYLKEHQEPQQCFSRHNFNQPISIRVDTNPYLYWFYDENSATIMVKKRQDVSDSRQFPSFQFKLEAGKLPRTVQIHPIKDYNSATQNLGHNYPTQKKVIVDNYRQGHLNKSSFVIVSGLNNPRKISLKLIPNGNLEGEDHFLVVVDDHLEVSSNVDNRKGMATFDVINPLEADNIDDRSQYQAPNTTVQSSPELEKLIGEPILTPSERLNQMVNQNSSLIESMEDSILKANMYLDTLTQYNDQRIHNLDRSIDKYLIGDNINNFYRIKKELKKVEDKMKEEEGKENIIPVTLETL